MTAARRRDNDLADVKALLQARADSLSQQLAPGGRMAGRYYMPPNPTRDDRTPGSFWIIVRGAGAGVWRDEATGDKGDIISLIGYCLGLDFRHSMEWARSWLGISELTPGDVTRARETVRRAQDHHDRHEAEVLAQKRRQALGSWLHAAETLRATPVETYLRTRGIELAALSQPPRAIRFAARKHRESGLILPAMLACMTGPDEKLWAVHTTYLAPDGNGKADVTPARKMWPSFKGAAIRLSKGETAMRPKEAASLGLIDTLLLCEGVEDGLSFAMACPRLRVWAAGSLGNLASITIPECASDVIVAADNDWGKPQAQRQLDSALRALGAQGKPVKVARSPIGKDANDALRGTS